MNIDLVIFDMSGTTVQDDQVVERCFYQAALRSGLRISRERIKDLMGWAKKDAIRMLWKELLGSMDHPTYYVEVNRTYRLFKSFLEEYYQNNQPKPTPGALQTFDWLHQHNVAIALVTDLYRNITNLILQKLGWIQQHTSSTNTHSLFHSTLCADEIDRGLPNPNMIFKTMEQLHIKDSRRVVFVGDTTSDLRAGKSANCLFTLGITNGSHPAHALKCYPNDGLLHSLESFPSFLSAALGQRGSITIN